ncbi:MAG: hypothetical protein KXJ61_14495 [Hydrogenophaga sp.]|jgi:hypothetical protein|uniref:hypothetical protein n=1 Tax=Hydrogenophaga sp. TaxID=1904254 RepID=UPI001DFD226C|nr:hypothetical protein [Hydrogenophaga sp.]MBW0171427.1 hypothetical protein [Hydrogenophaga sp.]MBW0184307.1 hypothetical protein [Hydrogenophaga sp.]
MTTDSESGDREGDEPKKKGFDFSSLLKHVAEVDTAIGKLYLFPLRTSDLQAFSALHATTHVDRARQFLPCIASLYPDYGLKHERVGITSEQASSLSDEMVEAIAEAFVSSNGLRSAREGGKDRAPIVREEDEHATAYLDRLMRSEVEEEANQFKKLREQVLGSTHGIFDQMRKASQALGDTRQQFERLTRASAFPSTGIPPSIEARSLELNNHMVEHSARLARERSEDREMVRLTGQMTAQSAETLQELAAAASTMLEKLDQRDEESKRTTKIQLWIAVGSVAVAAALAGASFLQDWFNNKSGDDWQAQVLDELKVSNLRSSKLEGENADLRQKVEDLSSAVRALESKPALSQTSPSKNTTKKK